MNFTNGWADDVRHCYSPNFDSRPDGCEPELIVIHNISLPPGQFGGAYVEAFFSNCLDHSAHPFFSEIQSTKVSAHFLIDRNGDLTQFVNVNDRAWHAGVSSFQGRERCNDFSIGIELEGEDLRPYTQQQYLCLTKLVVALIQEYAGLNQQSLTGHSDIAPGRKTDPGDAFEWNYWRNMVAASLC